MAEQNGAPVPAEDDRRRGGRLHLTRAEWLLLVVLGAVQFTHIVDFVIIMPLGKRFMAALDISTLEFSGLVAAYGFSAAVAGLLAAGLIDRFDRKTALLGLFAGVTAGTLLCALAPNYPLLLVARALTGAFGGVIQACVLAIVGDVFPDERRGTANGVVMSAFSVASITGVPGGIELANRLDSWRAPFAVLGVLGGAVLVLAWLVLPPLRGHLARGRHAPQVSTWAVMSEPGHLRAYALMTALVLSSFLVVPHLATYLVMNVGRGEQELSLVYLVGGAATLLTTPLAGRLSDRWGKLPVFRVLALAAVVPFLAVTNLPPVSLATAVAATTLLMIVTSGRMVPAMALLTACAAPCIRGSFLSVNASVQMVAMGLASLAGGALLHKEGDRLIRFPVVGALAAAAAVLSALLGGLLRPAEGGLEAVDVLGPSEARPRPDKRRALVQPGREPPEPARTPAG
jgi:predicted MFS family arabinose efflux permease